MEDVEIKEEPALNWRQIYEDSLDGKFSYVNEKDESGQEKGRYITNVQEYAKLWFNDESFRIRKLESFKTKEEVERNKDQALKPKEILKRFEDGVYDWKAAKINLGYEIWSEDGQVPKRGINFTGHFEKIKAFQSGTVETELIKERVIFDKKKIHMYDAKFNIGYICSEKEYFESTVPDIEVFVTENGILRSSAIAYIKSLKRRVREPLKDRIEEYLDTVIQNISYAPRLIYYLSDGRFEEQLKGKCIDYFILKNDREPTLKEIAQFPRPDDYLFDFGEDRISSLALSDAQTSAGGELFLKFYNKGEKDTGDILSQEMKNVTKKKNGFELNMLKLECIAYQLHINDFISLTREFKKEASGRTIFLDSEDGELATAFGLVALEDHKPVHGETVHRDEGIVEVEDRTDFCKGNLTYHLRAPLVYQRTEHATLTFVLPMHRPDVTVCLLLLKENSFFDENLQKYTVEILRVSHVEAMSDEIRQDVLQYENIRSVVLAKNRDATDLIQIVTKTAEKDARESVYKFKAKRTQFMPRGASKSSIHFYHSKLEPLEAVDDKPFFLNGLFCETCIEALPAPFWHRSRPKSFWEKCTTLVSKTKELLSPKREVEDKEIALRDVYALVVPKSGKLGPTKLVFRCFGVEHETDQIISKDRLELHYEKKGGGDSAYTVSKIYVVSTDPEKDTEDRKVIARCDTSKEREGHVGWDICDAALDVEDGYRKSDTYLRIFEWACERFANPQVVPHYSREALGELARYMILLAERFGMFTFMRDAEKFVNFQEKISIGISMDMDFEKNVYTLSKLLYRYEAEKLFYDKNILLIANEMRGACYRKLEEWTKDRTLMGELNPKKLSKKEDRIVWGTMFAHHLMVILPYSPLSSLKAMYDVVLKDICKAEQRYERTKLRYRNFLRYYNIAEAPPAKQVVRFQAMAMLHELCGV